MALDSGFSTVKRVDMQADGTGAVHYGTDDGLHVGFFIRPKLMEYLSQTAGQPIYQDRIYTRIIAPGMNKTQWEHETKGVEYETVVDDETGEPRTDYRVVDMMANGDKPEPHKFPNAWNAFIKRGAAIAQGWPIEQWGAVTRSMAESLKGLNVHTVEALAALTDAAAANIMGGMKYRDMAKASLDERKRNEILSREQEQRARSDERAAQLEKDVDALKAQLAALTAARDKAAVASDPIAAFKEESKLKRGKARPLGEVDAAA